jgi:predicted nuclease with TOPRIM domain
MRKQIQAGASGEHFMTPKVSLDDLHKTLAELKAKDADVRAKLEKIQDAQEKAKLEELLKKIAQKTEQVKMQIDEAKAQKVKTEAGQEIR